MTHLGEAEGVAALLLAAAADRPSQAAAAAAAADRPCQAAAAAARPQQPGAALTYQEEEGVRLPVGVEAALLLAAL